MKYLRSIARNSILIYKTLRNDVDRLYKSQYFPSKPHTINLLANDICNSRCKMCLIWKNKRDKEITPPELKKILSDILFSDIKHVGITGGEPTLRKDLPELFRVVCESLPELRGVSTITNAINKKQVVERVSDSSNVCKEFNKSFSLMVSLDGVGSVHDEQRGRQGNFDSAIDVINYFQKNTDIPVLAGCTITKKNVWNIDELFDYCQKESIKIRFRIADFINRLYNDQEIEIIRNFTPEESYHLALFFEKLALTYEKSGSVKRTYRNIRKMLFEDSKRTIACPYQYDAVMLDCRGYIQYCAPKSKIIGNALEQSAYKIWKGNLSERRRIIREDCNNCIHDYHAQKTLPELFTQIKNSRFKNLLSLKNGMSLYHRFFG